MGLFAELSSEMPIVVKNGNFNEFWAAYPKRRGSNPRAMAEKRWSAAVKSGADPEHILSSVKNYTDELREQNLIGTEFVCQASTWLNQKRYLDYAPDPGNRERQARIDADMARRGYRWESGRWVKIEFKLGA